MRALAALAVRFDALAERREESRATPRRRGSAPGRGDIIRGGRAHDNARTRPADRPALAPGAADGHRCVCRHYVLPETMQHPAVLSAVPGFAYMLMAYGLVPTGPALPTSESAMAMQRIGAGSLDELRDRSPCPGGGRCQRRIGDRWGFPREGGFVIRRPTRRRGDRLISSNPQIEALITDFAMPGLSGVELIAQAAQIRPNSRRW